MELPLASPPMTCVAHRILSYVPNEGLCDVTLPGPPGPPGWLCPRCLPTLAMLSVCVNTLNMLPPALDPLHRLITICRKPFPIGDQRVRIELNNGSGSQLLLQAPHPHSLRLDRPLIKCSRTVVCQNRSSVSSYRHLSYHYLLLVLSHGP